MENHLLQSYSSLSTSAAEQIAAFYQHVTTSPNRWEETPLPTITAAAARSRGHSLEDNYTSSEDEDDTLSSSNEEDVLADSIAFLRHKAELLERVSWLLQEQQGTKKSLASCLTVPAGSGRGSLLPMKSDGSSDNEEEDGSQEDEEEELLEGEERKHQAQQEEELFLPTSSELGVSITTEGADLQWNLKDAHIEDEEDLDNKEEELDEDEEGLDECQETGIDDLLEEANQGSIWSKAKRFLAHTSFCGASGESNDPEAALRRVRFREDLMATSKYAVPVPPSKKRCLLDLSFAQCVTAKQFDSRSNASSNSYNSVEQQDELPSFTAATSDISLPATSHDGSTEKQSTSVTLPRTPVPPTELPPMQLEGASFHPLLHTRRKESLEDGYDSDTRSSCVCQSQLATGDAIQEPPKQQPGLHQAMEITSKAVLIAEATAPFRIIHANKAFYDMAQGLDATDTLGRRLGHLLLVLKPSKDKTRGSRPTSKPYLDICQELCHPNCGPQENTAVLRLPIFSTNDVPHGGKSSGNIVGCRTRITPVWDSCPVWKPSSTKPPNMSEQHLSHLRIEVEPRKQKPKAAGTQVDGAPINTSSCSPGPPPPPRELPSKRPSTKEERNCQPTVRPVAELYQTHLHETIG